MVERKEDILLLGLRVAAGRISVGFSVASVLLVFEFRVSPPPLLLASATE